jgi:hypothetical protein
MRNGIKLKSILKLFVVSIEMDEVGVFSFHLFHKETGQQHQITAPNYSSGLSKAYTYYKQKESLEKEKQVI